MGREKVKPTAPPRVGGRVPVLHQVILVKVVDCLPNTWNYNRQDEDVYLKERRSIVDEGFLQPVLVRRHPEKDGKWQIVDGEHRWRAARDEGMVQITAVDATGKSEVAIRNLTMKMNLIKGTPQAIELGKLLKSISGEMTMKELSEKLPFTERELNALLASLDFDWGSFEGGGDDEEWVNVGPFFSRMGIPKMPVAVAAIIREEINRIATLAKLTGKNRFQALEYMAVNSSQTQMKEVE